MSAGEVALVPAGLRTVTSTVPALVCAGVVAVIWVLESTLKLVAAFAPKPTLFAKLKSVPVMVTVVPPVVLPVTGTTLVTVGMDMQRRSVRITSWLLVLT